MGRPLQRSRWGLVSWGVTSERLSTRGPVSVRNMFAVRMGRGHGRLRRLTGDDAMVGLATCAVRLRTQPGWVPETAVSQKRSRR